MVEQILCGDISGFLFYLFNTVRHWWSLVYLAYNLFSLCFYCQHFLTVLDVSIFISRNSAVLLRFKFIFLNMFYLFCCGWGMDLGKNNFWVSVLIFHHIVPRSEPRSSGLSAGPSEPPSIFSNSSSLSNDSDLCEEVSVLKVQ